MAEKNDSELICTVCFEQFTEPKLLPCCHTFCKGCLDGVLEISKEKEKLTCPRKDCHTEHQVPPHGFDNDSTIVSSRKTTKESTEDPDITKKTCEQCMLRCKAVSHCQTCSHYLCTGCTQAHRTMKAFNDHEIDEDTSVSLLCSKHQGKTLTLYCKGCESLACLTCLTDHKGHDIEEINTQTRREIKEKLDCLVKEAKSKNAGSREDLKYIDEVDKHKEKAPDDLKEEIEQVFGTAIQSLEKQKEDLLKAVEELTNLNKKTLIWAQRELVETRIAHLEGAINYAARISQCSHDSAFVKGGNHVIKRLEELNQKSLEISAIENFELTTTQFTIHDQIPSRVGELTTTQCTPKLEIVFPGLPKTVKFCEQVQIEIRVGLKINEAESKTGKCCTPVVKITRQNEDEEIVNTCTKESGCTWTVSFRPVVIGQHTVSVQAEMEFGDRKITNEKHAVITVKGTLAIEECCGGADGDRVTSSSAVQDQ